MSKQTLLRVKKRIAELSFRDFVDEAWPITEPDRLVGGFWLNAICSHLQAVVENRIKDLIINIQPRIGKSTLTCVLFPAWAWTTRPQLRFLYGSYSYGLAIRDSVKCRRVIESQWYQDRWGEMFRLAGDQNTKEKFENDAGGHRICVSVGGATTGHGGDIVLCDDPHEILRAESDIERQSVLDWWDRVMSVRVNNPKTGHRVVIMQRLHENDLTGHILETGTGYDHLCIPSIFDSENQKPPTSIGWKDPRKKLGELICPERFDNDYYLDRKTRMGSYAYAGQFQQRPEPAEGGIIKRAWINYYDAVPAMEEFDIVIQSWDAAFKDSANSSYVVGQTWGRRYGSQFYLLDQVRDRMEFTQAYEAVLAARAKWPAVSAVLIEDKANGPAIISALRAHVPGIIPVNPQGGKDVRCQAVAPLWEAGNVFVPSAGLAAWTNDFVAETTSFPSAKNDDQVDAMTQALVWLSQSATVRRNRPSFGSAARRAGGIGH